MPGAYFLIDGQPAIVMAVVIRPEASYQDFKRLSYLVFVDVLTPDKLQTLGESFDLHDLRVTSDVGAVVPAPSLVVRSDRGVALLLQWRFEGMGGQLRALFLPLLAVLCGAALLRVWYLRRRIAVAAWQMQEAERALRHSEQRFRSVSEAASDWI